MQKFISKYFIDNIKLQLLYKQKRFTSGCINFRKFHIKYEDSLSLYNELNDIFKKQIYYFNAQNDRPFIVDAGGYIGLSSLYFKHLYPNAEVITFEPDPDIFKTLKYNIEVNQLSNVTLINAGLGKREEVVTFYNDGADGGSLYFDDAKAQKKHIDILCLSSFINKPVDLLKMNIEGAEGDVFEEIEPKLHFVKEIIFEYHAFSDLPQKLDVILGTLSRNGFRYLVTDATSAKIPVPFSLALQHRYFNLVYAKKT